MSSGGYRFRYEDGTSFTIDSEGRHMGMAWLPELTLEDATTYLLGPVFGFILRLRGTVCLHASAVVHEGGAVAFMAPPGFGKSTLAAMMALRGFPVLTDDILALEKRDDSYVALPAFPRLHLWPQAVESLFGDADALARISPGDPVWDKRYLPLDEGKYTFQTEPLPLGVIYTARYQDDVKSPRICSLQGREALTSMLSNAYSWYALDREMRAREFDALHRILPTLSIRCIESREREAVSMQELGNMIERDLIDIRKA